ncbi:MAG: ricin-type beta-trefoil lectin domain protein, partial [Patescibacteria group bacterium]
RAFGPAVSFTATGEGLTLKDIVPEAGSLKAFDALALNLVSVTAAAVQVDGTLNGKAVKFVRTRGDKPVATVTAAGMVLGDLYAPLAGLPAVNAVAVDKISLDGSSVEAEARLNGVTVDVIAHANQGAEGAYVSVFFNSISAATFIPAAQGHLVNDLALEKALFIIQPAGSGRAVTAADLPGDLPRLVNWPAGVSLNLSEGVNFAATLATARSGKLADAFKTVGLPPVSVFVKGTVSQSTFKGMTPGAALADADKQAMLAGLDLSVDLPLPTLPAIAGLVTVKGPVTLNIGGDARNKSSLWARVPAAIAASKPKGDLDVSVQFQLDIVGAGIGEKLDALVSMDKGARGGLSLLALYEGTWKQPFGIQGLTLADGGFEFALDGKEAAAKSSLAFFATAQIGGKNVAVTADLKRADGKISLDYFELDGKFRLADFPGGKNIPSGDKFELDQLKLSVNGLEAKTVLAGHSVNAYLFNAGAAATPNWVFAIQQKDFKITELLPPAKAIKPLAAMTIPNAALIISEKGLKGADRNSLGVIAKDMFDGILGKSNVPVNLPDGIGLLAEFDANAMGAVGKGLNAIGVHDDAIIMGAVTGVFQGNPGVMLSLAMENAGAAKGLPGKIMTFKPGVPPAYFIQWAGPDLYAGLRTAVLVKAGKETIDFTTDIELQFGEAGAGVKVLGEKNGPWTRPFGIKGLTLNNVKMDVAITPAGEVQFGVAGDQQYGSCHDLKSKDCVDVDLAMSVKVPLEDGLPDGVAFSGKVNPLGIPALMEITETLMSVPPGSIAKLPVPFFQINNAQLAFATPGASDPQLGLVSDGFAFAGNFFFLNKDLGHVTGAGGPAGLRIKGAIGDIDLEVLKFTDNTVDISLNQDPKYVINANVTLLGAPQKVAIDIKPPHFSFDMTEKLGAFGNALLTVTMDGFDLKKGTFDKNAGISVVGEFQSTLQPWMKAEVKRGVEDLRDSAKAKFEADNRALNEAMDKVNQLTAKIQKLKEEDQKAKDRADDALNSAKRRVDSLSDKYDHETHQAHHCGSRWTHWACSPGWRIAAASTWVIYEVAEKSLDAAKKAIAAASNLDPRVAALLAERDVERAGLSVAKAVVSVAEDVEDFVMKELETVLEKAVSDMPLEIDKTFIVGDLKDMVTHNDPLVLDMQFKLVGAPMHEFFAVKIPVNEANAQFDAGSFALLPALAMDKLTEDALSKLSPAAARWVHSHIATQIADAEDTVRQAVEAQEEKYKAVMATFDNGTAKYKKAFADQADDHLKLVEGMDVSDLMPNSLQYQNTYLAIGHSSLCLAVSKDGLSVVQLPCKDADVQQWSTVALKDDAAGYVELKNKGLCLKARQGDERDGFEPLILSGCDQDDLHEQWKIISADGFFDEIVNRASQKCLHFDKEDANPESAYAKWTSCLGTDSQTFRDISDAEKPTWHKVESMVKAANGLCLDVVEQTENALQLTPDKKEIKLYAHKCGDGSEKFNYIEEVDGDIRLVHTETGACVYPQEKATTLALRACDRGEDMFWRINAKSANADQFYIAPRD